MEGYDTDWRMAGLDRVAHYTNLSPGSYVFKVRASNPSGVWSEAGVSVPILVAPPWWRTSWAYSLCAALLLAALVAAERLRHASIVRRERHRASLRESEIRSEIAESKAVHAAEHADRLEQLDEAKSRFFANVSHEFRTPLTLILGAAEDAERGRFGRLPDAARDAQNVIIRSARRVDRLVRQLLDLARLESGRMSLQPRRADLSRLVLDAVRAHVPLAERKGLVLSHRLPSDPVVAVFDLEKLRTALGNLVANAVKFTESGGKVDVSVQTAEGRDGDRVHIVVRDTGMGIPEEDLDRVFERFSQVDASATRKAEGIGIGLAMVRELVELHGGSVRAESELGFGSTFTIDLPLDGEATVLPDTQTAEDGFAAEALECVCEASSIEVETASPCVRTDGDDCVQGERAYAAPFTSAGAPTVVIVEDNQDVRVLLRSHLEPDFLVVEAVDGMEGLERCRTYSPDLVISDIMMPEMDGIELCRAIKGNPGLRNTPVILLTARAGEKETLQGLSAGADEYITKPFSVSVLRQLALNLVSSRRGLREDYSHKVIVEPSGVEIESEDEGFLRRVVSAVEEHLGDSGFTIDELADEIGLSRRQLQRRLPDLCGETPSGLVRRMRLERARQLLDAEIGNVSEIAYASGYKSASHFSVAFRRAYRMSPSEYRTTHRKA
jgi:signal transduction histidine kinase/DNA-binding response OmpR family regulator